MSKTSVETSKKLLIFIAILFLFSICLSAAIYLYTLTACIECSYEFLITIVTVSGGSFSTAAGFYYNKAKTENIYKLKKDLLKDRYEYLKEFQVMNDDKADYEMEQALDDLETELNSAEAVDITDGR